MAEPANYAEGDGGFYANEGTAAHTLASDMLKTPGYAPPLTPIMVGKDIIDVTEEFLDHVQTYVDDVRRRAIGGYLMIEQRVTLEGVEGFDESNYGTSDCIIAMPEHASPEGTGAYGVVEDLKFGMGEKVYAWEYANDDSPFWMSHWIDEIEWRVVPNYQLMMYALAALQDIRLLVDDPSFVRIVINQPRIGNLSELDVPIAVLERFALFAAEAKVRAVGALELSKAEAQGFPELFKPGEKQCRWCKWADCKARNAKVMEEVGADFDAIDSTSLPVLGNSPVDISKALQAIPFIKDWIVAVQSKAQEMVAAGIPVLGSDGKPMKFVEGDLGNRKWTDLKIAEALLVGVLGPKAYAPQTILTAPAAAKILDKKQSKNLWKETFEPLIGRAPGKPILVNGSDPRPEFSNANAADDFEATE